MSNCSMPPTPLIPLAVALATPVALLVPLHYDVPMDSGPARRLDATVAYRPTGYDKPLAGPEVSLLHFVYPRLRPATKPCGDGEALIFLGPDASGRVEVWAWESDDPDLAACLVERVRELRLVSDGVRVWHRVENPQTRRAEAELEAELARRYAQFRLQYATPQPSPKPRRTPYPNPLIALDNDA